jgi:hypothetical protein
VLALDLSPQMIRIARQRSAHYTNVEFQRADACDSYLTLAQLRQRCQVLLPGVKIRKHLFWRYSLIWKKLS